MADGSSGKRRASATSIQHGPSPSVEDAGARTRFSRDGEQFEFASRHALMASLHRAGELQAGVPYWSAEVAQVSPEWLANLIARQAHGQLLNALGAGGGRGASEVDRVSIAGIAEAAAPVIAAVSGNQPLLRAQPPQRHAIDADDIEAFHAARRSSEGAPPEAPLGVGGTVLRFPLEGALRPPPGARSRPGKAAGAKRARRKWTAREDRVMAEVYPVGGANGVLQALGGQRSLDSIRVRAIKLGLQRDASAAWSDEETRVLREVFPVQGGKGALEALAGSRSLPAIRTRAKALGLVHEGHNGARSPAWTAAEDEIVKARMPEGGAKAAHRALGGARSLSAVRTRAQKLGVSGPSREEWLPAEVDCIRSVYPTGGAQGVFDALQGAKSLTAIYQKANRLGITRVDTAEAEGARAFTSAKAWSPREDAAVVAHYATKGARFVFDALKGSRSLIAIRTRAGALGLSSARSSDWSETQLATLNAVFPERGVEGVHEALAGAKSLHAIRRKARDLGLVHGRLTAFGR
jgi:hypothetical protein